MKISFITTVLNEEHTITSFLQSLAQQTQFPDEVIIVDGGSKDKTISTIDQFVNKLPKLKFKIKILIKPGNRSVGRNEAIRNAAYKIIVCTDGDCILDRYWISRIINPLNDSNIDVVAGYYEGLAKTIFQACLIPYVLVMPNKVNSSTFLPASRSVAFRKSIWQKIGGFPEEFSHNEDYVFAKNLKKANAKIVFARDAIVYWLPRKNLKEAFNMFYRFAMGDMQSGIIRAKVVFLFLRYIFGLVLLFVSIKVLLLVPFVVLLLLVYLLWAMRKNFAYVQDWRAIFILPALQLTSDLAVIIGSVKAIITK